MDSLYFPHDIQIVAGQGAEIARGQDEQQTKFSQIVPDDTCVEQGAFVPHQRHISDKT